MKTPLQKYLPTEGWFSLKKLPSGRFLSNAAFLQVISLAYNLVEALKVLGLPVDKHHLPDTTPTNSNRKSFATPKSVWKYPKTTKLNPLSEN